MDNPDTKGTSAPHADSRHNTNANDRARGAEVNPGSCSADSFDTEGAVLVSNKAAVAFWRAVGYMDYALTLEILPSSEK